MSARGVPHYLYQSRRVATQTNAAGGAIVVDISPASGQSFRIVSAQVVNSGTNSIRMSVLDEDFAEHTRLEAVASAAATIGRIPKAYASATSDTPGASLDAAIQSGQCLSLYHTGAGADNDTMTVSVELELIGNGTVPTWSKARSTNEADVTLAASTIAASEVVFLGCW